MSSAERLATNKVVLSANRTVMTPCRWARRQLTDIERKAPRTEPCGTPDITGESSEPSELMEVRCCLSLSYHVNH